MLTRLRIGLLAASALAAPALAQQAPDNGTVGPSEIRDFSLPGERPAPAREPEPTIAPAPTPRAEPTPAPAPAPSPTVTPEAPAQNPAPPVRVPEASPRVPAERTARPTRAAPVVQNAPGQILDTLAPEPAAPAPAPIPSAPAAGAPAVAPPVAVGRTAPAAAQPDESGGLPWLWLALAAGLGIAAVAFFRARRAQAATAAGSELLLTERAPAPNPAPPRAQPVAPVAPAAPAKADPIPAPTGQPSGSVGIVMRPWLEIEFRPERAVATEAGAEVRYEIAIRNTGNAPARNVRLAARMFSAGPELDREIAAFYGRGVDDKGAAPLTILPRSEVRFQSVVSLPRDQVREIKMEGRSLFVPTVAFNLLYAWGRDKSGQTCSSHVVGREAETPSAKMGPFRLDQGPRVWRSVGQRPSALARAV